VPDFRETPQSAVLPAIRHAKNACLAAIVFSDERKRRELARHYGCQAYGAHDLDTVLELPEVDAVYIAEPDDKHALWRGDAPPFSRSRANSRPN
jgi:glucose-fructose oxidoreductase